MLWQYSWSLKPAMLLAVESCVAQLNIWSVSLSARLTSITINQLVDIFGYGHLTAAFLCSRNCSTNYIFSRVKFRESVFTNSFGVIDKSCCLPWSIFLKQARKWLIRYFQWNECRQEEKSYWTSTLTWTLIYRNFKQMEVLPWTHWT